MYAVIETGGKQYRVSPGQTVEVELLPAEPGSTVALDRVLLVSTGETTLVGKPAVPGAKVVATVAREGRGDKVIVFKFHSKKRYRRKTGHRQDYTYLTITDIQAEGESLVPDEERKRYEAQAARAARRYEARLAEAIEALAFSEAIGSAEAIRRAEDEIEQVDGEVSIPDEDLAPEAEDNATADDDKPASKKKKK